MPAIADIIINKSPMEVWSVIADVSSHPYWLSPDTVTKYLSEGEPAEGMKFALLNNRTGVKIEGEVVALNSGRFLKVRVDLPQDAFATVEYHLLAVSGGCAVRALDEVYATGDTRLSYFPEQKEQECRHKLERLKRYCEIGVKSHV